MAKAKKRKSFSSFLNNSIDFTLLVAVLQKKVGIKLDSEDVYLNVVRWVKNK